MLYSYEDFLVEKAGNLKKLPQNVLKRIIRYAGGPNSKISSFKSKSAPKALSELKDTSKYAGMIVKDLETNRTVYYVVKGDNYLSSFRFAIYDSFGNLGKQLFRSSSPSYDNKWDNYTDSIYNSVVKFENSPNEYKNKTDYTRGKYGNNVRYYTKSEDITQENLKEMFGDMKKDGIKLGFEFIEIDVISQQKRQERQSLGRFHNDRDLETLSGIQPQTIKKYFKKKFIGDIDVMIEEFQKNTKKIINSLDKLEDINYDTLHTMEKGIQENLNEIISKIRSSSSDLKDLLKIFNSFDGKPGEILKTKDSEYSYNDKFKDFKEIISKYNNK